MNAHSLSIGPIQSVPALRSVPEESLPPLRALCIRAPCTARAVGATPVLVGLIPRACSNEHAEVACASIRGLWLRQSTLCFSVSKDEEYVGLRIHQGEVVADLGARSHNFLLLTLARHRLADASEGHPETTCGWTDLDELGRDPSMATPKLNVDVFRIRRHLLSRGVRDAEAIIERRPGCRQLRIGAGRISIVAV